MAEEIKGPARFKPKGVYHIPSGTWLDRVPADCKEIVATSPDEYAFEAPEKGPDPDVEAAADPDNEAPRRGPGRPRKTA